MRTVAAVTVCLCLVFTTASCSGSPDPKASVGAPGVDAPAGWVRYGYGLLGVAVPQTWKLSRSEPPTCRPPEAETVFESSTSTVTPSAGCGSSTDTRRPASVWLECLTGQAGGLFSGGTRITVDGHALGSMGGNIIYIRDNGTEGAVSADGPASLVRQILATVRPTREHC